MRRVATVVLGAASVVGIGATVMAVDALFPNGLTAGSDLKAYIDAGTAIREGAPIYTTGIATGSFVYSPTWAVLFAPLSLLPGAFLQAAIMVLEVLVLRYILGSWRAVGWMGLYPLTWYALASGNVDILIAGAIVAAWKHTSIPLAVMTFAKVSPAFALDVRRLREFAIGSLILVAITIPWFDQWFEYARFLIGQPSSAGTVVPIPWYIRLPFALLLLLPRRPWTSALAAVVAIPLWFWYTSVILIAPLRLWLDERHRGAEARRALLPADVLTVPTPDGDIP